MYWRLVPKGLKVLLAFIKLKNTNRTPLITPSSITHWQDVIYFCHFSHHLILLYNLNPFGTRQYQASVHWRWGFSISYLHQAPDVNVLTPGVKGVPKGTKICQCTDVWGLMEVRFYVIPSVNTLTGPSLIGGNIFFCQLWLINIILGVHEPFWLVKWD